MWWPQARGGLRQPLAEPVTISTRKQSMDGCSPSCAQGSPSSAGLNVSLQNTFSHHGRRQGDLCCSLRSVPSTRQGVPSSGIIPRMGSMQSVHALAGLIRLRVSSCLPQQTRDEETLVGKRCEEEEEEGRRRRGGSHLIPSRCLENPNCAVFS